MLCITSQIALWFEYWRIFNRMISLTNVFGLLFIHEWWSEDLCRQQPFTIWYCFACHFCWFLFNSCSVSNRSSIFIGSDDVIKVCILLGCYISRSIRRKCRNKHQCLTEHSQLSVKIWLILIGSCFVLSAIKWRRDWFLAFISLSFCWRWNNFEFIVIRRSSNGVVGGDVILLF